MVILRSGVETCYSTMSSRSNEALEERIEIISRSLKDIHDLLAKSIEDRNLEITKLQTRINVLECQVKLGQHFALLHERKMDDMEQLSRKVNLRLVGIEVCRNDSPFELMSKIEKDLEENEIELPSSEIDRCHRVGPRYIYNGKTYQDALIKFDFWRSRDTMYQNRKKNGFRVFADLTSRSAGILDQAKHDVINVPSVSDVVDFVFADVNCKLKLKSKTNRLFWIQLICWILEFCWTLKRGLLRWRGFRDEEIWWKTGWTFLLICYLPFSLFHVFSKFLCVGQQ